MIKIYIIFWLFSGLIAAGFFNKNLQSDTYRWNTYDKCEEWSRRNQSFSMLFILGGPPALIAVLAITGFGYQGWSLKRKSCDNH